VFAGISVRSLKNFTSTRATITSSHKFPSLKKSLAKAARSNRPSVAPYSCRCAALICRTYAEYQLVLGMSSLQFWAKQAEVEWTPHFPWFILRPMSAHPSHAPREIKKTGTSGITVSWTDGSVSELSSETLRRLCPCAACREKRGDDSHAKPLTGKKRSLMIIESNLQQELELQQIWGVGQYAIGMRWGDGHDSGIYTFEYLRGLAG
jgi:DUF971 family protein